LIQINRRIYSSSENCLGSEQNQDTFVLCTHVNKYILKRSVPLQAWKGPEGSRKIRFPDFVTTAQDGGRLSVLGTGHLYTQEINLVINSVKG